MSIPVHPAVSLPPSPCRSFAPMMRPPPEIVPDAPQHHSLLHVARQCIDWHAGVLAWALPDPERHAWVPVQVTEVRGDNCVVAYVYRRFELELNLPAGQRVLSLMMVPANHLAPFNLLPEHVQTRKQRRAADALLRATDS